MNKIKYYSYSNSDSLLHYAKILEKSENSCVSDAGKNNISSAYYKLGNFERSEEIVLEVLTRLKDKNSLCNLNNKLHALTRLFWIKNNQRKFDDAFDYLNQKINILDNYSQKSKSFTQTK